MSSKRLFLYATDAYKLSSLLVRHVLLAKPPPTGKPTSRVGYYGDKTRQLLFDLSRPTQPNVVAIKLLEFHRELNLIKYRGIQNYVRQWWSSSQESLGVINNSNANMTVNNNSNNIVVDDCDGQTNTTTTEKSVQKKKKEKKHVARVAFMITSEMRHKLITNLGYTTQDIRTLTPQEAMLLLEYNVMKEGDDVVVAGRENCSFRDRLNERMKKEEEGEQEENEEKELLLNVVRQNNNVNAEHAINYDTMPGDRNSLDGISSSSKIINIRLSLTPEEAQDINVKPDVAMALLSAKNNTNKDVTTEDEVGKDFHARELIVEDEKKINTEQEKKHQIMIPPMIGLDNSSSTKSSDSIHHPTLPILIDVTPHESEGLRMKPDVAAAILTSQRQEQQQNDFHAETRRSVEGDDDGPMGWYEVIERLPDDNYSMSNNISKNVNNEQQNVIALFTTEKEALECARLKQSILALRSKKGDEQLGDYDDDEDDKRYLVRRRLNKD